MRGILISSLIGGCMGFLLGWCVSLLLSAHLRRPRDRSAPIVYFYRRPEIDAIPQTVHTGAEIYREDHE